MTHPKRTKLNDLFKTVPPGAVLTSEWLNKQGYRYDLVQHYRKKGWVHPIGRGAVSLVGQKVSWEGAVYAMQVQMGLKVHLAAKTALGLHGIQHFLPLGKDKIILFGKAGVKLPSWFLNYDWEVRVKFFTTKLFDKNLGIKKILTRDELPLAISCRERAILETLHLVPHAQSFDEAEKLMEGLTNLRPDLLQELLAKCHSYKVRRLFLYLGEKLNYPWFSKIDVAKIDLGKGKRVIEKHGRFDPKYQITVPVNAFEA